MSKSSVIGHRVGPLVSRRQCLALISTSGLLAAGTAEQVLAQALPVVRHPPISALQAGDLLWTAQPGSFIPYGSGGSPSEQATQWTDERNAALVRLRASANLADHAMAEIIEGVSYEQLQAGYFEDRKLEEFKVYAGNGFAVGHIAIVDEDAQGLHVIEARPDALSTASAAFSRFKKGVVRTPYPRWIEGNYGSLVWHGRLRGISASDRARVAAVARAKVERDYWFWSFDLADASAFYCSKLVWFAAHEAIGLALDGDKSTARRIWVSPKRLMRQTASIEMLFSPAAYG